VGFAGMARAVLTPDCVAIVYNSKLPESKSLAEIYQRARGIPVENMIGLDLSEKTDISREDYNRTLLEPLRAQFDERGWWKRQKAANGMVVPIQNKIRVLVMMRGVPLRIEPTSRSSQDKRHDPINDHDEASVDSELAMFGAEGTPILGVLENKFYKSEKSITDVDLPYLVLTARIDAASLVTCERMVKDAVETEKTGLWGRAYVDIANKIPEGDEWLEEVIQKNALVGIPTVVDRFNQTFPKNYPMADASLYYGWYDRDVSGPFLNPSFRFRKGAVAMHLHSFSAEQLTNPNKNWSAALLERGAAVTIGNVYEPYLHLTHNFGIIHSRLLAGSTWVEACWAAMPVTSWQSIVLGDPLYRPFCHFGGSGVKQDSDIEYRALHAAHLEWPTDRIERESQLQKAAERMKSGVIEEAVGLDFVNLGKDADAAQAFRKAKSFYLKTEDQLRQDFNLIGIDRSANRKNLTVAELHEAITHYAAIPGVEGLKAWLETLDAPPKVEPENQPPVKH
jgi:uncharacterized protein (TIGR03790 family)